MLTFKDLKIINYGGSSMADVCAIIGSRKTPPNMLTLITQIASWLAQQGYYIRTGAADGADWASLLGAKDKTILYLPWEVYQADKLNYLYKHENLNFKIGCTSPTNDAIALAEKYHPSHGNWTLGVAKLMGRNMHIISGINLDKPVEFVIYWAEEVDSHVYGGTGQGIRYARDLGIPVCNLYFEDTFEKVKLWLNNNTSIISTVAL
jgi:hypothetical protein